MNQQKHFEILKNKQVFENKTFHNDICEEDFETNGDIKFSNCVFKGNFSFKNIKSENIAFTKCSFEKECIISEFNSSSLLFSDIKFLSDSCYISGTSNSISVFNKISGQSLELSGWHKKLQVLSNTIKTLKLKDINTEYSPMETRIEIEEENDITQLNFESLSNHSKIEFNGGKFEWINFRGTFNDDISFNDNISIEYVFFESSILKGRLDIKKGNYHYINLYRSSFHGLININGYDVLENKATELFIDDISFHSSYFEKTVSVSLQTLNTISISNNDFKQLFDFNSHLDTSKNDEYTSVNISGSNQGNIIIENIYADVSINDINLGNIYFKDIALYTLYVNEFINRGNVAFSNLYAGVFLIINKSILGNFNLFNEDLNKFEETVIADSNLEGIKLGVYPKKIRSYSSNPKIGYGIKDKRQNSKNLKNVYNQLKQVAKTSGDIDIMYRYKSLELRELIKIKRVGFDSILLILNWISNNNGKSWFRGVLFTLITAFIFFMQYVEMNSTEIYQNYVLFISSFPKLNLDKYEQFNENWDVCLIIWISRIFVSYGIYQTISAFRKYGKN